MMSNKFENIKIGVNKWFKSDISIVKQFTQIIVKDDDDNESDDINVNKIIPHYIHITKQ